MSKTNKSKLKTRTETTIKVIDEDYKYRDSLFLISVGRPFRQIPTGKQIIGRILQLTSDKTSHFLVFYHESNHSLKKTLRLS